MPRGDGTGPAGMGSRSGRGLGQGMGGGRGMGMSSGRGIGMGRRVLGRGVDQVASNTILSGNPVSQPQMTRGEKIATLRENVRALEQQIQDIERRIGQMREDKSHAVAHVDSQKCRGCGMCVDFCPVEAITINDVAAIDKGKCIGCWACIDGCPFDAISMS